MAEAPGVPIPGGPPVGTWKTPLRGALVVGASSDAELAATLQRTVADGSRPPARTPPNQDDLIAPVRIAIDFGNLDELADAAARAVAALRSGVPAMWRILRNRGVHLGRGCRPKTAFLYPGLNTQYVNMLAGLRATEPIVAEAFVEADRFLTPVLGRPLTDYLFVHTDDPEALERAEQQLLGTDVTQPAILTADLAITRLLAAYGVRPDMVLGHSLGEFAALVAAGSFTLPAAIEAAVEVGHARIRRMVDVLGDDPGAMVAMLAPPSEVERVVRSVEGYIAIANVNSSAQAVVGGATAAVESATKAFEDAGYTTIRLPVSHAFHTPVTAAYEPLKRTLLELGFRPPVVPVVANATGEFYPAGLEEGLDLACREVDEPVQFVQGLQTLYAAGARVFVEVGPKKVLHGFTEDVLGSAYDDVLILFTNHPKFADAVAFNRALCGLYAAGLGGPALPAGP